MNKQAREPIDEPSATPSVSHPAAARYCAVCGTKLSGYNPGPNCWQHTVGYPWRGPTAKPKYDP